MIKLDLSLNQELLILFAIFVFIVLITATLVENRELKQKAKKDKELQEKQRAIIAFYRTYMLERHGKVFDEEAQELARYKTKEIFDDILKEDEDII